MKTLSICLLVIAIILLVAYVFVGIYTGMSVATARNYDPDTTNSPKSWTLGHMEKDLRLFKPDISESDWSPFFISVEYEDHYVDGQRGELHLQWFQKNTDFKTVIMFPGSKLHNKSSPGLLVAGMFLKHDFNVIMAEYTDHGQSDTDDGLRNFGTHEKYDCVDIWDYVVNTGISEESIYVYGQSMGGTLGLILSQYRACSLVITDSAPVNMEELLHGVYEVGKIPWLYPICSSLTAFYLRNKRVWLPDLVPNPNCRYLMIYNESDIMVNIKHLHKFDELAKKGIIKSEIFSGDHMGGPFLETERYMKTIVDFFYGNP